MSRPCEATLVRLGERVTAQCFSCGWRSDATFPPDLGGLLQARLTANAHTLGAALVKALVRP